MENILYTQLPKQNNLKDYIKSVFSFAKRYGNNYKLCVSTFKDETCVKLENGPARRSFEDILKIVKHHYPEVTKEKVAVAIYELFEEGFIISLYCKDIDKFVFFGRNKKPCTAIKLVLGVEYLPLNEDIDYRGNGEYSIKEILDLAGIND